MKIKLIALAVAALVSGAANAAIDSGVVSGNGNLLFTAWDDQSSYTMNTGYTIDSFNAAVTAGTMSYSFTGALLSNWLLTAGTPVQSVQWTLFAGDAKSPFRTITTSDNSNAGVTLNNANAKSTDVINGAFIDTGLNLGGPFATAGVTEAVSLAGTAAYTGASSLAYGLSGYGLNFNSNGTLANNTAATGLSVISITATNGLANTFSVYTPYTTAGAPVTAWLAADKSFHIGAVAAVPEADSLAMLLAGMGLVGSIVRRRNRKTA